LARLGVFGIAESSLEAGYGFERRRGLRLGLRLGDGFVDWFDGGFDRAGLTKLDDLLEAAVELAEVASGVEGDAGHLLGSVAVAEGDAEDFDFGGDVAAAAVVVDEGVVVDVAVEVFDGGGTTEILGGAAAAEAPPAGGGLVEEEGFGDSLRLPFGFEGVADGLELGEFGFLAVGEDGLGGESMGDAVQANGGFATGGARAGGLLGVGAVGGDLAVGCHSKLLKNKSQIGFDAF